MAYIDIDIYGRTNDSGSPVVHTGDDAVINAIVAWLTSKKGDYLYRPNLGGVLDSLMFKIPGNTKENALVKYEVSKTIEQEFAGLVTVEYFEVYPDSVNREWLVDLQVRSLLSGELRSLEIALEGSSVPDWTNKQWIDVIHEGENCLNFVMLLISQMEGKRLLYNSDCNKWTWGDFRFLNLTEADPLFEDIKMAINGA